MTSIWARLWSLESALGLSLLLRAFFAIGCLSGELGVTTRYLSDLIAKLRACMVMGVMGSQSESGELLWRSCELGRDTRVHHQAQTVIFHSLNNALHLILADMTEKVRGWDTLGSRLALLAPAAVLLIEHRLLNLIQVDD